VPELVLVFHVLCVGGERFRAGLAPLGEQFQPTSQTVRLVVLFVELDTPSFFFALFVDS